MHYRTRPRAIVRRVVHGTSGDRFDYCRQRHEINVDYVILDIFVNPIALRTAKTLWS